VSIHKLLLGGRIGLTLVFFQFATVSRIGIVQKTLAYQKVLCYFAANQSKIRMAILYIAEYMTIIDLRHLKKKKKSIFSENLRKQFMKFLTSGNRNAPKCPHKFCNSQLHNIYFSIY
jgi:hypothetical protein